MPTAVRIPDAAGGVKLLKQHFFTELRMSPGIGEAAHVH
jgi:hypothetical protein